MVFLRRGTGGAAWLHPPMVHDMAAPKGHYSQGRVEETEMSAWWTSEDEVAYENPQHPGPKLLLQKGFYRFNDGQADEPGFRFIWRLANGKLQARGPAVIESLDVLGTLVDLGRKKGWCAPIQTKTLPSIGET
jgi:hypothetical protein